jgi:multidrug efflux pump subunit AcrA (membrane-fusion protein)
MKRLYEIYTVIIIALFLSACSKDENKEVDSKPKPKAPLVKVEVLKPVSISKTIKLTGTVEAKVSANVVAPIDGYIEKLNARENDFIRKDKVLTVIGSQERISLMSQTKNKVIEIETQLKNASPDSEEFSQLNEQLNRAKKELDYAEKLFLGIPVIAPLNGTVTQKFIETGSVVTAKQILFNIVDFNSLIIKSSVSEDLYSKIKMNDKLKVKFNAMPDKEFIARVTLKNPQIDPATRNFAVELKLVNNAKGFTPGMMAEIELVTEKKENTLTIPNDVLIVDQKGQKFVYIVQDSTAYRRNITTGISNNVVTEIIKGLKEGENLVVMGQELLKDGIKVIIQKSKESKKENEKVK